MKGGKYMPNSLRSKLSSLRYKRLLTDEEYKELINKLGGHDREIRNKTIEEVMEVVKRAYHNFSGYDLEFMTKYGNKNASQQAESYSKLMMYEIAGEFDDLIDNLEQMKGGAE